MSTGDPMIVYIPQRIETAEQADALPEGTIAKHPEYRTAAVKTDLCEEGIALWYDTDDGSQTATSLLGWTALVPVEAEEEYSAENSYGGRDLTSSLAAAQLDAELHGTTAQSRLVTPWEEA